MYESESFLEMLVKMGWLLISWGVGWCWGAENKILTDPRDIERALRMGEFIRDGASLFPHSSTGVGVGADRKMSMLMPETLALISLSKYRHLKRAYQDPKPSAHRDDKPK